jgi:hypothetical protein
MVDPDGIDPDVLRPARERADLEHAGQDDLLGWV